nr:phosphotransferase [Halorussus sp. JP-T4]
MPDAELRDAVPVEEGKNAVYRLVVAADGERRNLVLKVGDHHFAAGCRAEPRLLDAVAERTDVPVPPVVGTGEFGEDPYFLMERVAGANLACDPDGLSADAFERVCVEAGRNLAVLHEAFPVGSDAARADVDAIPTGDDPFAVDGWGVLGLDAGADDLHLARGFPDWPTYFEAWLGHNADRLADTRFSDLRPAVSARAEAMADDLRELAPFDPVVTHGDYRLANLLVDPETGATRAVLDWATPTAAPAAWDLAVTEALLVDWPSVGEHRQEQLRERLHDGYRERSPSVLDREGFETHRRCCLFGARLRLMVNLGEEMAGRPASAVDARAREHRDALREFGVE